MISREAVELVLVKADLVRPWNWDSADVTSATEGRSVRRKRVVRIGLALGVYQTMLTWEVVGEDY